MKRQYTFIILLLLILYISYLILTHLYKEYKIRDYAEYIKEFNEEIVEKNEESLKEIRYLSSRALKNKILKEQQSRIMRGEELYTLTSEDQYKKYTKPLSEIQEEVETIKITEENEIYEMSIYERWMYFLFTKET